MTGWVDCGSAGADNVDQIAATARAAPQIGRVLVNISRTGNASGELTGGGCLNAHRQLSAITGTLSAMHRNDCQRCGGICNLLGVLQGTRASIF